MDKSPKQLHLKMMEARIEGNYRRITKSEWALFILCAIAILFVRLIHISNLYGPIVMWDEAGYWSHAANIAGMSWTEVLSTWYSYGYSLLLAPLFYLTHDMTTLYRIAIVENAVLGVVAFFLGIKIIKNLYPECKNGIAILISFVAASYSSYTFQSQIAWSETFLYTWFMLVLWLCICFLKKPSVLRGGIFSFGVGFLYIIHNRALPIIVALVLLVIFLLIQRQIGWKSALAITITLMAVMVLNYYIKIGLSHLMWGRPDGFRGNDIASQSDHLKLFFSLDGIKTLIFSLSGKIWYLFTSTLTLAYWGGMYLISQMWKEVKRNKQSIEGTFCLFVLLCSLGVVAVATISMPHSDARIDLLIYGRYSDMIAGILILLGLLYLQRCVFSRKYLLECFFAVEITVAAGTVVNKLISPVVDSAIFNIVCVPGILYSRQPFNVQNVTSIAVATMCVILLFNCFAKSDFIKSVRMTAFGAVILFCTMFFGVVGNNTYFSYIAPHQSSIKQYKNVYIFFNEHKDAPVFVNSGDFVYTGRLRMQVTESDIKYSLPKENIDNYFLLQKRKISNINEVNDYYFITSVQGYSNEGYDILVKGNLLVDLLQQEGHMLWKISNRKNMEYDDVNIMCHEDVIETTKGNPIQIDMKFECDDGWFYENVHNYRVAYHIFDTEGNRLVWDGRRTSFSGVYNGMTVELEIDEAVFAQPGEYILQIDAVEEGVTWLSEQGMETEEIRIIVQ